MDVTRKNFSEVLQGLDKVISESAFLALDGEFTGLVNGTDVKAFDTTSEYYRKVRDGSMKFLFVQFGLSAFKYSEKQKQWTHNTFNFYIFPRPYNRFIEDPRFTCQSSSIDFLASNGFDFNKVFREGIPYMTEMEEERQRKFLTDRHNKSNQNGSTAAKNNAPPVPIPEEYEAFIAKTCSLIEEFLKSDQAELELERTSAFVRKLLYQTAEEKYPGVVRLDTRPTEDGSRVLFVTREGTDEERLEREREKQQRELQELDDAFGFSKVIRLLRESKKLLVGHNMILDVCHVLNRFCSPLPYEYSDFKETLASTFPRLMDTKYIANSDPFKDLVKSTVLSDLHKILSQKPFEMPDVASDSEVDAMQFSSSTGKYHEAGYDAYVTGMCFLTLAQHLASGLPCQDVATLPLLKPYLNRLIVTRLQDIDHINLHGDDPKPPRDHVFHITFPRDWRFNDILKLFSDFGNVFISWLDDTSAYVALYERDQAQYVTKKLPSSKQYRVVPYHKYHQAQGGSRVPCSPTTTQLRRRSLEKLQEAEQGAASRKRKSTGPAKESKFSRRSIDTIVEEEDSNAADEAPAVVNLVKTFEESDSWD